MPSELYKRIDLDKIWPPLLYRSFDVIAAARKRGADYYAVSGLRSFEDQAQKYAVGRTAGRPGSVITNAKPGYSMHNYGLAIDFCLDADKAPGLQPDWNNTRGQYAILRECALNTGLQVGVPTVPGGDPGHMQVNVTGCFRMQEMTLLMKLRGLYLGANGDMMKVWQWLEGNVNWPKPSTAAP